MRALTYKGAKCYMHLFENGRHTEASWEQELPVFFNELDII